MSVKLQIDDGSPHWWDSQAIWVVPGNDPLATPGVPAVGDSAYLWARVRNAGTTDVQQAKVDFWVANPSLQLRKSISRFIGSAFVDVAAGGQQDVLCLTPWSVELINGGHECLIAEASHTLDPPSPPPSDPDLIDPVGYRQIAQRNLNVVTLGQSMMKVLTIGIHAGRRSPRVLTVEAVTGGEVPRDWPGNLGIKLARRASEGAVTVGISDRPACGPDVSKQHRLQFRVPAGSSLPVYLGIRLDKDVAPGDYTLVRLIEREGDKPVGGITFIIVATEDR